MGIRRSEVACPICRRSDDAPVVAVGRDFEYDTCAEQFTLRRCATCDVIYLSPRPDACELERIYPPQYNAFHFHRIRNPIVRGGRQWVQKGKVSAIRRLVPPDADIIDVGCGSGALLQLMARHGSPGWRLVGSDFNADALAALEPSGIATLVGRFEELELDRQFDLIILNQAIEHFDDPAAVVAKAAEALKPGGILFIETPCTEGFDARLFHARYWGGYHIPRHWTLFSRSSIRRLLGDNGFDDVSIRFLASPSFWIQSCHHYFLDRGYPTWWVKLWVFRNPLLLAAFTLADTACARLGLPTSNMRVIARRVDR